MQASTSTSTQWDRTIYTQTETLDCPTDFEEDPTTTQEVLTGWEGSGWAPIEALKADGSWDCHEAAILNTTSFHSGYMSHADVLQTTKYQQLSFRTKHYLHNYVQRILEATCFRYAREHFAVELGDCEWRRQKFVLPGDFKSGDLAFRDWLMEDGNELDSWMRLFTHGAIKMPKSGRVFNNVLHLRNAAVHRGKLVDEDGSWELAFENLTSAMELPALLKDLEAEKELADLLGHIMEDPALDKKTTASVEYAMYTPPCRTRWQLLLRMQALIEETCFKHASRKIPDVLTKKGWEVPEQVELKEWKFAFADANVEHDESANDLFPASAMDSGYLTNILDGAQVKIRNAANHRKPITEEQLVAEVHRAIRICILQSDWHHAIETEVLAEMHFTRHSRGRVLTRLASVYMDGEAENAYEQGRRVAIVDFLQKQEWTVDGEVEEEEELEWLAPGDVHSRVAWVTWTWSPSMHGSLKRLQEKEEEEQQDVELLQEQEDGHQQQEQVEERHQLKDYEDEKEEE